MRPHNQVFKQTECTKKAAPLRDAAFFFNAMRRGRYFVRTAAIDIIFASLPSGPGANISMVM
jgi:hypothetical protein